MMPCLIARRRMGAGEWHAGDRAAGNGVQPRTSGLEFAGGPPAGGRWPAARPCITSCARSEAWEQRLPRPLGHCASPLWLLQATSDECYKRDGSRSM